MPNKKIATKVLALFFGERRLYPSNTEENFEMLERQLQHSKELDSGLQHDLLLVNHDIGNEEINNRLNLLDGTHIRNGIVRVLHRPWVVPDYSFGSFKYAMAKCFYDYEYFFFSEDDQLELKDGNFRGMIDMLNSDSNLGFVGALNLNISHRSILDKDGYILRMDNCWPPHAHGGCGVTSISIIKKVLKRFPMYLNVPEGKINYTKMEYTSAEQQEIDFTNTICQAGFKIKAYSDGTKFLRVQTGELC